MNVKLAKEFHKKTCVIDLVSPLVAKEQYISTYQEGGVNIIGATIAVNDDCIKTLCTISEWFTRFRRLGKQIIHILHVQDIETAINQNKIGIIFHFQNSTPLDGKIELVELYYRLGVRVMQLTYNRQNAFGYGCEEEVDKGLTMEGRALIAEMNRVGMVIDLSHAGYKTTLDAIDCSNQPTILSHSNALSLCYSGRNVPDEVIKSVAKKKGVIGLNAFPALISRKSTQPDLTELINHVKYVRNLVGIDHISLGLDYYTGQWPFENDEAALKNYNSFVDRGVWNPKNYPPPPHKYPIDLETPDKIGNLTYQLLKNGFSEEDAKKILSGNLLRIFSQIWR